MKMNLKVWKTDTLNALRVAQSSMKPDREKVEALKQVLDSIEFLQEEGETETVLGGEAAAFIETLYP